MLSLRKEKIIGTDCMMKRKTMLALWKIENSGDIVYSNGDNLRCSVLLESLGTF